MILSAFIFTILLSLNIIRSFELNSMFGRLNCYNNEQLNCSENFIDVYPHLSKSAMNLTDADTHFLLFTRRNPDHPEKLHKCGGKLPPTTHFDPSEETLFIVHSFMNSICNVAFYREWIYQILKRGNYNILLADYSWGCLIDYGTCKLNIRIVAQQSVIVLENIEKRMGKITVSVIGHSLGAQLAGLIGQDFHLRKITALDPAGPGFDARLVPPQERLDRGDADFVEVWFCNSGKRLPKLGTSYNVGHVNFYINGGKVQKGCHKYALKAMEKGDLFYGIPTFLFSNLCSHMHCTQYYKAAINPGNCKFVAVSCKSYSDFNSGKCKCGKDGHNCIVMGFDTEKYVPKNITYPQKYFLNTTDTCPYCDIDLSSALIFYNNKQPDCNQDFTDAYPELSKSATNLTKLYTHFLLFTRRNPDQPEKLHKCGGRLPPTTNFDPSQELIVITLPFATSMGIAAVHKEWLYQILQRGNYNVLVIDYYNSSNLPDYKTTVLNLKVVAKQSVRVLKNIEERMGKNNVTVVGLSLGAQLAGLIGQGFPLKKITALDPAGPGFDAELVPPEDRLDKGDADFVEVWSCNMGRCLPYLGTPYNIGHVQFYINGGKVQRSCHKYAFISMLKGDIGYGIAMAVAPDVCYHIQCAQYYKVAINPGNCKFVAVTCDSYSDFNSGKCKCGMDGHNCIVMGFDTEKYVQSNVTNPQIYYLNTTDDCPFCDNNPSYLGSFSDPYP